MDSHAAEKPADRVRRVLRERRWLILAITLTFVGVALLYESRVEKVYQATAIVQTRAKSQEAPLLYKARRAPDRDPTLEQVNLSAVLLPGALEDAARTLSREHPGITLAGAPLAGPIGPGLTRIGISGKDPVAGAVIANAVAEAVVERARRAEVAAINRQIRAVRRRRAKLKRSDFANDFLLLVGRDNFNLELARLKIERETAVGAAVIAPAQAPTAPAFKPGKRVLPMLVLGLGLALVVALLLDVLSSRTRDPGRLAAAARMPVAGLLPQPSRRNAMPAVMAFGRLRTAVEPLMPSGGRVVAVVAPTPADHDASVAVGLGEAFTAVGLRACVVECDERRPVLAERLKLYGPGLSHVLHGRAELSSALRRVKAPGAGHDLTLLPAGGPLESPAGEPEPDLSDLLARLEAAFDVVVLDLPALSAGAGRWLRSTPEAPLLLCARAGQTLLDELSDHGRPLRRTDDRPLVLVVTGLSRRALAGAGTRRRSRARRRWAPASPSLGRSS